MYLWSDEYTVFCSLAAAVASYGSLEDVVVPKESAREEKLDKSLVGRQVAVKIDRLGWCVGKIMKFYANRRDGINYEIRFVTRDAGLRNAYLTDDAYGDDDDRLGTWVFGRPPVAPRAVIRDDNSSSMVGIRKAPRKRARRSQFAEDVSAAGISIRMLCVRGGSTGGRWVPVPAGYRCVL